MILDSTHKNIHFDENGYTARQSKANQTTDWLFDFMYYNFDNFA